MTQRFKAGLLALVLGLVSIGAQASTIDFVLGNNSSVTPTVTSGGLKLSARLFDFGGDSFSLEIGESRTFNFFSLYVGCNNPIGCVGTGTIEASLDFLLPESSADGSGSGWGKSLFFGILDMGSFTWTTQPGIITTDLGTFSVVFSNLSGISIFCEHVITATVTALAAPAPVPLPAAAWLFLSGLLGVGGLKKLRQRRQEAVAA